MLDKVMNAPINLYYDVTPVPRLIGYFTRDLNSIDTGFMTAI